MNPRFDYVTDPTVAAYQRMRRLLGEQGLTPRDHFDWVESISLVVIEAVSAHDPSPIVAVRSCGLLPQHILPKHVAAFQQVWRMAGHARDRFGEWVDEIGPESPEAAVLSQLRAPSQRPRTLLRGELAASDEVLQHLEDFGLVQFTTGVVACRLTDPYGRGHADRLWEALSDSPLDEPVDPNRLVSLI